MTTLIAASVTYTVGSKSLVAGVSLELRAGELLAVVGPNGAGKSTLLGLLAGDLTPSAGSVQLEGGRLSSYGKKQLAKLRAVLPQRSELRFAFRVREVVALGRYAHSDESDDAVARALEATDMTEFADRLYPSLSGGERSRVDLARVLAQDTPVLLLDEPTAALDLRHQHETLQIARRLAEEGRSVLAVLHDLNLAARYADRIAVMSHGQLVRTGPPDDVLTADLVGAVFGCEVSITRHPTTGHPVVLAG